MLCPVGRRAAASRRLLAFTRRLSSSSEPQSVRNIGISAHIDSGKTTLTERILYYTGRIGAIHEVRGKDGVGAKMDFMELEREKGITIQSAATHCAWGDHDINVIDTPGHVDFTIEAAALRPSEPCGRRQLPPAVCTLVSPAPGLLRRYSVPRLAFINKLDREGSDPDAVIGQLRDKLRLNAVAMQIPIGVSGDHEGVVDLLERRALRFSGPGGEEVEEGEVPAGLQAAMEEKRAELLEKLADADEEIAEFYLAEEEPPLGVLRAAIRRQTIANAITPVFMGSAFKNKGVQPLLDGVVSYLPAPTEVTNCALDLDKDEEQVGLTGVSSDPFVGLAFKLEEGKFGQLTYMRIYQGKVGRGDTIQSMAADRRKVRIPRLVRMHANEMEDVESVGAGDIVAMFGVDCASGTTFTDGKTKLSMTSMFVPDPVSSLALEDPTFRVHTDDESGQTIISGMGELHLEIYVERLKREYGVECSTGNPKVAFRETASTRSKFAYTHKKQSGGSGQFGRVEGYVEPISSDALGQGAYEFDNQLVGNMIPPEFVTAIDKAPLSAAGFREAMLKGTLTGSPVMGMRVVLQDGLAHAVDSNELAFRAAAQGAFKQAMATAKPVLLEPLMSTEVAVPAEFQGTAVALVSQRKGTVNSMEGAEFVTIDADVPLESMFGFSSDLRGVTQGKGEYTMEYKAHVPAPRDKTELMVKKWKEQQAGKSEE
ncbi:putative mitochondrial elongation factor [Emiliania huxleyi CCMP1516]|uniref:Elongation factor G, mitochondrial n=2 Tax=Emiliania huxleyi TaxID=2903 RepID=A0A0D3KJY0_EMIH1|nr:putative mitochondrial elongation factor [Emiliania huxleyi CCMP1516]EOD36065.1 putative mitochondrial elongation factor [Emiliania huxleyi CCMP1516]|eukprot:XP_005788494.1 putative mitochondrial elongation factor [Emiliania huxleyi CCMP1516]